MGRTVAAVVISEGRCTEMRFLKVLGLVCLCVALPPVGVVVGIGMIVRGVRR